MDALILSALQESATPALYRRNAFRVTGLPTNVDEDVVRQLRSTARSPEAVRAYDRILGDPRRRLIEELFWLWDTEILRCACPGAVHREHDAAVRAHSSALRLESRSAKLSDGELRRLDEVWITAARAWDEQLERLSLVEQHLLHRMRVLDERLDGAVLEGLHGELRKTLYRPLVSLYATVQPERRAALGRAALAWPAPPDFGRDPLSYQAEPLSERIEAVMRDVRHSLDAGDLAATTKLLRQSLLPAIRQLSAVAPPERHPRTSNLRNEVALLINEFGLQILESRGSTAEKLARRWFTTAEHFAADPQTRRMVIANNNFANEIVDQERHLGLQPPIDVPVYRRPPWPPALRWTVGVLAVVLVALLIPWLMWAWNYGR